MITLSLWLIFCSICISRQEERDAIDDKGFSEYLFKSYRHSMSNERRLKDRVERNAHAHVIEHNPPIRLPGDYTPLPGRTTFGDYWPLYPFSNQYHSSLTIDPSTSKHFGGDIIAPVPFWGLLDMSGHFVERVHDYAHRIAYVNAPINMMGLRRDQLVRLYTSPSLQYNRELQPSLPLGLIPKSSIPLNCKPPLCNPYTHTFSFGFEQDEPIRQETSEGGGEHGGGEGHGGEGHGGEGEGHGGEGEGEGSEGGEHGEGEGEEHHNPLEGIFHVDGYEGEFDMAVPVGKDIAYRLPVSGRIYFDRDNISVAYGQNFGPIDPLSGMATMMGLKESRKSPYEEENTFALPEMKDIVVERSGEGRRRNKRETTIDPEEMTNEEWEEMIVDFESLPDGTEDKEKSNEEENEQSGTVSPLAALMENKITSKGEQIEYLHTFQNLIADQLRVKTDNDLFIQLYREQQKNLEKLAEGWKTYKGLWGEEEESYP